MMNKQITLNRLRSLSEPEGEGMVCSRCGAFMVEEGLFEWYCDSCGHTFSEEQYIDDYNNDE
jgi:ribosomal protein L37AE/L43A